MRVFITGISSGLGAGIGEAALAGGAEVWGCSRRSPEALIGRYGDRLRWIPLDLRDDQRGPAALADFIAGEKGFDRVVLNAGVLPPIADVGETPLSTLRDTMEVNVWANKWILDELFADGRNVQQVIAISSGASVSGSRGWNGYAISKAALNMLIQLLAAERPDCHCISLAPGLVDTAMQDYLTGLPEDARFSTVDRLKAAKGTPTMPDALTAGHRCWEVCGKLREWASGSFVDLREIGSEG